MNPIRSCSGAKDQPPMRSPVALVTVKWINTTPARATNIVNNGLNVEQWRASRPEGLLSDKGFSLTTDESTAHDWANFNHRVSDCGCDPGVIEANIEDLAPYLRTGDGTSSVDPNEFYIEPNDFNKIGPGVFRFSPRQP